MNFVSETAATYLGNAANVRDFRVQMRTGRTVWLFGIYLSILILLVFIVYGEASSARQVSVVDAQGRLGGLYQAIMLTLATILCVVTPALTATTIVLERSRRSLDLVFSAPVTPRYYLVGKMLSSFRFTWMLLVLSLPVTAACVVLGGASWNDVIGAYVLLSFHGLVLTALALFASANAPKMTSAIASAYLFVLGYCALGAFLFATLFGARMAMGMRGRTVDNEAPFLVAMSPFFVRESAATTTMLWGTAVPNWILAAVACLLLCKIILLGTGAVMGHYGAPEVKSLRVHGLVYVLLFASYGMFGIAQASPVGTGSQPGLWGFWGTVPFLLFAPLMSTFAYDSARRFRFNGFFGPRHILDGTPAGGLPYYMAIVLAMFASVAIGYHFAGRPVPPGAFLLYLLYALATATFAWSLGMLISSFGVGLRPARALTILAVLVAFVLPFPILSATYSQFIGFGNPLDWPMLEIVLLRPAFDDQGLPVRVPVMTGVLLLLSAVMIAFAARNTRILKAYHEARIQPQS